MTKQTTAAFIVSPKYIGSWGDQGWRIREIYELIEGGSTSYLMRNQAQAASSGHLMDSLSIPHPSHEPLLDALVALMSISANTPQCISILRESHNLVEGERLSLAPYWEMAPEVLDALCNELSGVFRIGLISFEELSMANCEFVALARSKGFQLNVFE